MWKRKLEVVKFWWKRKHFEEAGSELGSIFYKTWGRDVEVANFLWKRKQTRKRLNLYGAGSGSKNILLLPHPWFEYPLVIAIWISSSNNLTCNGVNLRETLWKLLSYQLELVLFVGLLRLKIKIYSVRKCTLWFTRWTKASIHC